MNDHNFRFAVREQPIRKGVITVYGARVEAFLDTSGALLFPTDDDRALRGMAKRCRLPYRTFTHPTTGEERVGTIIPKLHNVYRAVEEAESER